jgi:hypothetical protein
MAIKRAYVLRIARDTSRQAWQNGGCVQIGAWRSLVARLPWAQLKRILQV